MKENQVLRKAEQALCQQMTLGSHILYVEGQNDFNHGQISARIPKEDEFLVRGAALGFDEVEEDDFVKVNLVGEKISGHRQVPPEWPIHTSIYRAHPSVNSIVHTHAVNSVIFSSLGQKLRPISHDGCPFYENLPIFADTTNTITTVEMANAMLRSLGDAKAILLKNHGIVTTGKTIKEAVISAIILERACAMQLRVPTGLEFSTSDEEDVASKNKFIFSEVALTTYWQYFSRKVQRVKGHTQLPETRTL
jgi:L-fuculose-phosphate aldolase